MHWLWAFTMTSGILLGLGLAVQLGKLEASWARVFLPGIWLVGAEGFYTCLFLLTFEAFSSDFGRIIMNLIFFTALVLALVVGTGAEVEPLRQIFGSFITVWLTKAFFTEIPWRGIGWWWATVLASAACWPLALLVHANPQYFNQLFWLFK